MYNYIKLIVEDVNKIDSLAKRINIIIIPKARQKLETYVVAN